VNYERNKKGARFFETQCIIAFAARLEIKVKNDDILFQVQFAIFYITYMNIIIV